MEDSITCEVVNDDLDQILMAIEQRKKLALNVVQKLCEKAIELFQNVDKLVKVNSPITVVGDIHGQFSDLLEIFEMGGRVPDTNYLFLGDYINRGFDSVECFSYLLALKLRYPSRITLLRGNHESSSIGRIYGFYDECKKKYGSILAWKYFSSVFEYLPLAAIIENEIFCVHAGLSPDINYVDKISSLTKDESNEEYGPLCHLLWNDPDENEDSWNFQSCGPTIQFGKKVTKQFLQRNNLKQIFRAHQMIDEGYKYMHDDKLCSIFSAPNYCGRCNNTASFVEFDDAMNTNFQSFTQVKKKNNSKLQSQNQNPQQAVQLEDQEDQQNMMQIE